MKILETEIEFLKILIFDLQEFNFENDGPYPSKIFGGYSNVWGGTLFEPTKSEVKLYNSLDIDILNTSN